MKRLAARGRSLRVRLPVLLFLYSALVGPVIYLIVNATQEGRFEQEFLTRQYARATDLQERTERAAERSELDTAQREFGELAADEALRAAVFVGPDNRVLLTSRRQWRHRPIDLAAMAVPPADRARVEEEMRLSRQEKRTRSHFTADRNGLVLILPASLPLAPGAMDVDRSAQIVLVYDLTLSKAINTHWLRQLFLWIAGAVTAAMVLLAVTLHFAVTRRLERIHDLIGRFAEGQAIDAPSSRAPDEIGAIAERFQQMARTVRREMQERLDVNAALLSSEPRLHRVNRTLRAISHCNQVLVHATDEPSLLEEVCRVVVEDGGYRMAWVGFMRSERVHAGARFGDDNGYIDNLLARWNRSGADLQAPIGFLVAGKPLITNDYLTEPSVEGWRDIALQSGIRSSASMPLREEDGRTFGALLVYSDQPGTFDDEDVAMLTEMSNDLAYGIHVLRSRTRRQKAEAEVRAANERYARHESALATLTRAHVHHPDQFPEVLRSVVEVMTAALDTNRVSVWRRVGPQVFRCETLFEWPANAHHQGMQLSNEVMEDLARVLAESDVVAAADVQADPRFGAFLADYFASVGIGAFLAVPIRVHGRMIASLSCGQVGAVRTWTADEQTFAIAVANLLSSLYAQVERLNLEAQLRQATKLDGIGQLAGGVAHDFNNVLTVILGKADHLIMDARLPADLRDAAEDITHSADRAANLTRQLLAFSRRQAMQVRDLDLNEVIRNVARLLDRIIGEDVGLELLIAPEPIYVKADAGMIDQVVLNLAVNARDAMRGGGRLVVDTSTIERDADSTIGDGRPGGHYARLRVTDTGSGIAPQHLAHIFEPFFTTKDVGKGTGLGLATTYGIIQQHNGWIDVDSEVGRGTTFSIYLPSFAAPAAQVDGEAAAARPAVVPRAAMDRETVLVVEDEEEVRALIVDALIGFGYRVLEASSGPAALELWNAHRSTIDLLLTDMVMPGGMNGLDLASQLKGERPGLRIIYISGYLADVSREVLAQAERANYLAKPFTLPTLARLVRHALDAVSEPET